MKHLAVAETTKTIQNANDILLKYQNILLNNSDSLSLIYEYEKLIKEFTKVENATIAFIKNNIIEIPTQYRCIKIDFESGGILQESYFTKEEYLVKQARISSLYRANIDNPENKQIKDILTIPIQNKNKIEIIVQVATEKESNKVFSKADIIGIKHLIHSYISQSSFIKQKIDKSNTHKCYNILIVDDSYIILKYLESIFKKYNIKTFSTDIPIKAIEIFKKKKIDFILIDEYMPLLSGHEVITQIKDIEKEKNLKSIPIIAITSDTLAKTRDTLIKAGAVEVLHKPLLEKLMIKTMQKYEKITLNK